MSSIPPHIAISYQPKSVYEPIKRITPAVNQFIPDPVMASQTPLPPKPQPEPEGPTAKELRQIFDDQSGYIGDEQVMWSSDFVVAARSVLSLWGLPTPQPAPPELTDEELDALERQCWEATGVVNEALQKEELFDYRAFARAAIAVDRARWGRP